MNIETKGAVLQSPQRKPTPQKPDGSAETPKPAHRKLHIQEILVPTDFSEHSDRALKHALLVAEQFGAGITLLHVVEPPVGFPDLPDLGAIPPDVFRIPVEQSMARLCTREQLRAPRLRQTMILRGNPAEKIIEAAVEQHSDLLVLATHGRTGLARILLGSTAEKIIRHAPCPVLVIRPLGQQTTAGPGVFRTPTSVPS